ncbi:MAG TPA: hypothetical protein VGO00_17930 [Kofleriaceae bacterium]|nr:hypothetical protein [Kofleriaceae bacterium]
MTWTRVRRGNTLWVGAVIAALPVIYAAVAGAREIDLRANGLFTIEELLLAVLPAMFVSASVGEDIENRTAAYLWSRPLPRWSIIAGKLVTLVPIAIAFQLASQIAALAVGWGRFPDVSTLVGLAAGVVTVSCVATAISILVPKYGMALTLCYVLLFDLGVGELPASLREISISYQARQIATGELASPIIAMAAIGGVCLTIALWRLRRLEA